MRCCVLAVLFLAVAVGGAQPVAGPFILLQEAASNIDLNDVYVTMNDSVAHVIFRWYGNLVYLAARSDSGTVIVTPTLLREGDPAWQMSVPAMTKLGDGWAAIVYELGTFGNRTWYYCGHDGLHAETLVESANNYCTGNEYLCTASLKLCHALAPERNGISFLGWVADWTVVRPGWMEGGTENLCREIHGSGLGPLNYQAEVMEASRLRLQLVSGDSVRALAQSGDGLVQWSVPSDMYFPEFTDWPCPAGILSDWLVTDGGHSFVLLRAANDSTHGRLVELATDGCEERFQLDRDPISWASHPDYGMAWVCLTGSSLLLYRADTTGAVMGEGIFGPVGEGYSVGGCALTLSDSGRVVLVWSENSEESSLYSRLRMATLGWDTPLAIPQTSVNLPPSAFNLSAYPNPFNSELRIDYSLPQAGDIELAAYNLLGQRVAVMQSGPVAAGAHLAQWSPTLAGGVYFITLRTAETTRATKVLYLK